eukprot:gnl/TRDRNA2_/TRDRNA2_129342_c2_seq1.p1 gnl/TRDRNA2_/TRDRNA2_129342_c2~~gnl/TRDRNA2_/TRDRNA2_129342_c2_seq1.p1  ORF type:complete len:478 (+),score=118.33 gnl/TRDRNA2_/TRDRNA2_129342_c2_seq1:66-1436(+)
MEPDSANCTAAVQDLEGPVDAEQMLDVDVTNVDLEVTGVKRTTPSSTAAATGVKRQRKVVDLAEDDVVAIESGNESSGSSSSSSSSGRSRIRSRNQTFGAAAATALLSASQAVDVDESERVIERQLALPVGSATRLQQVGEFISVMADTGSVINVAAHVDNPKESMLHISGTEIAVGRAVSQLEMLYIGHLQSVLRPGAAVLIRGLQSNPQLNGTEGCCERWDEKAQRWVVRIETAEQTRHMSLKVMNLDALESTPQAPQPEATVEAPCHNVMAQVEVPAELMSAVVGPNGSALVELRNACGGIMIAMQPSEQPGGPLTAFVGPGPKEHVELAERTLRKRLGMDVAAESTDAPLITEADVPGQSGKRQASDDEAEEIICDKPPSEAVDVGAAAPAVGKAEAKEVPCDKPPSEAVDVGAAGAAVGKAADGAADADDKKKSEADGGAVGFFGRLFGRR